MVEAAGSQSGVRAQRLAIAQGMMVKHYLEIMTPSPVTVTANTPLAEAARLMWADRIGGIPVVASDLLRFVMATAQRTIAVPDQPLFSLEKV